MDHATMPSASIEERVRAAILRALGPGVAPGGPLAMGTTPGWDSMGHMTIVMELEREFGVRFRAFELPRLLDVESIARAIREMPAP